MPHFPVLKKRRISWTLHPFSEQMMRFEQQGAVPWKICFSLSFSVSLALSYSLSLSLSLSLSHSFSPSSYSVWRTTCTSGCLREISGESIQALSSIAPGSVTAGPRRACSLPELFSSRLAMLKLAALWLMMCSEKVLQWHWAFSGRSALPIHLTHVTG